MSEPCGHILDPLSHIICSLPYFTVRRVGDPNSALHACTPFTHRIIFSALPQMICRNIFLQMVALPWIWSVAEGLGKPWSHEGLPPSVSVTCLKAYAWLVHLTQKKARPGQSRVQCWSRTNTGSYGLGSRPPPVSRRLLGTPSLWACFCPCQSSMGFLRCLLETAQRRSCSLILLWNREGAHSWIMLVLLEDHVGKQKQLWWDLLNRVG